MTNTFQPTSFTVTATFATLASYLGSAGFTNIAANSVTSQDGYIRNDDVLLNLYVGFGDTAPTSYEIVGPKSALLFNGGMNVNQIWIRAASSTVVVGFAEGASAYVPPTVNGVIGQVTATENIVPKVDADGNLVLSSITDDGTTVTATEPVISAHATTPYFETASGKTNTGYVNIKGKTSGSIKIKPADATGQVVTLATAAQTVGATTLTIPDQANVSSNFVFDTLTQELTNKTLTLPLIKNGLTASGSVANTFVSSTGTFITSSGANTLSGATDINAATTPSLTLNAGKTNTGFVQINGKTSGAMKFLPVDATAQTVTIQTAAQTVGASTLTIPDQANVSSDFVFTTLAQSLTNKTITASGLITTAAGTTAIANINTPAGTLKTTAVAGDLEYDGAARYTTNNTTSGRSAIYADNYFRLTATGGTISTIANYFGANSNPILVSGGYYEIDIYAWFLKTTAGTVTWTFTNTAAPTSQDIYYEMAPITGIVAPPGTATMLVGQIYNDATAAKALTVTGTLSDAVNHYMHTKIFLINSTGTSLQIQATVSAGTITPGIGSRWFCRRLPATSTGLFAA